MPNTASAKKRERQNVKRRLRNRLLVSRLRTQLRKFRAAASPDEMAAQLSPAFSALDHAVTKGVLHRKTADRKKSRLALALKKAQAGA